MVILGVILLVLGLLFGFQLLVVLGVILLILGLVFGGLGHYGRPIGGRRYWY